MLHLFSRNFRFIARGIKKCFVIIFLTQITENSFGFGLKFIIKASILAVISVANVIDGPQE